MAGCGCGSGQTEKFQRNTLLALLSINAVMFVAEIVLGFLAQSAGLIADSLDMFADAAVYGISYFAVGAALKKQVEAATISGYLQVFLGLSVLAEVFRRVYLGSEPESALIMIVGCGALIANLVCLALISKHRDGGVHMRASWIFSTNDVIANLGVIIAGFLVSSTGSYLPDLIIGALISIVVVRGGLHILKEAKETAAKSGCVSRS